MGVLKVLSGGAPLLPLLAALPACTWTLQSTDCAREAAALGASQSGEDSGQAVNDDTGGGDTGGDTGAGTGGDTGAGTGGDTGAGTGGDTGATGDPPLRAMVSIDPATGQTLCNQAEDGLDPSGTRWVYGGYFVVSPSGAWATGRWYQPWPADDRCPLPEEWAPLALLDFLLTPTGATPSWEPRGFVVEAKPEDFAMIAFEVMPTDLFVAGEGLSEPPTATWTAPTRPPPVQPFFGAARDDTEQVWVNEMTLHNVIAYEGGADLVDVRRAESIRPFAPAPLPAAMEAVAAERW